jgi:hypothetical protein
MLDNSVVANFVLDPYIVVVDVVVLEFEAIIIGIRPEPDVVVIVHVVVIYRGILDSPELSAAGAAASDGLACPGAIRRDIRCRHRVR